MLMCGVLKWDLRGEWGTGVKSEEKVWPFLEMPIAYSLQMLWCKRWCWKLPQRSEFPKTAAAYFTDYTKNTLIPFSMSPLYLRSPYLHSQSPKDLKLDEQMRVLPWTWWTLGHSVECKPNFSVADLQMEGSIRERIQCSIYRGVQFSGGGKSLLD